MHFTVIRPQNVKVRSDDLIDRHVFIKRDVAPSHLLYLSTQKLCGQPRLGDSSASWFSHDCISNFSSNNTNKDTIIVGTCQMIAALLLGSVANLLNPRVWTAHTFMLKRPQPLN